MDQHTLSVILNYVAVGVVIYVCIRWLRKLKSQQKGTEKPISVPLKMRLTRTVALVVISGVIIGGIFLIPEWMGRKDATAVCDSISVGTQFRFDMESLNTYRNEQKSNYGSLFAANYYQKVKGVEDGSGAIILVFLAGFPFSRAYCVLNLNQGIVESTRLMFNAEDYEYCDGEMRGLWECPDEKQK